MEDPPIRSNKVKQCLRYTISGALGPAGGSMSKAVANCIADRTGYAVGQHILPALSEAHISLLADADHA